MKSNSTTKLIKVVYNDGKCYKCNGNNLTEVKKDGESHCLDCSIDIIVFDYYTIEEYEKMYSL